MLSDADWCSNKVQTGSLLSKHTSGDSPVIFCMFGLLWSFWEVSSGSLFDWFGLVYSQSFVKTKANQTKQKKILSCFLEYLKDEQKELCSWRPIKGIKRGCTASLQHLTALPWPLPLWWVSPKPFLMPTKCEVLKFLTSIFLQGFLLERWAQREARSDPLQCTVLWSSKSFPTSHLPQYPPPSLIMPGCLQN